MTDELLIKFLLKETSAEESVTVQNWLTASPSNKTRFEQFQKIWNSSKELSGKSSIDENDAWERFKQSTNQMAYDKPAVRQLKPTIPYWLKTAAAIVIIAAAWSVYNLFSPVSYTPLTAGSTVVKEVLPDGSELTLNKHTQLGYAVNFKKNRSIRLQQGEVFFNVAHDETKPFIINVDEISVLVVGTSFNVKHLAGQTEVIVETGIVKVTTAKDEITLYKGEKLNIKNKTGRLIKAKNTDQLYNYYHSNKFVFNGTPLWQVVEVLNEAYGTDIVIKDVAIKNITLFTTLKTTASIAYNLSVICDALNIRLVHNKQQVLLYNNVK